MEPTAAHPLLGLTYPHRVSLTPDRGSLRVFRGGLVGVVAASTSLGLHLAAHGNLPDISIVLAGLGVAALIGMTTSGRQFGFHRSLAVLLLLQPILNTLLVVGSHPPHDGAAMAPLAVWPAPLMVCAHLVAALVGALWVAQGDEILWRWLGNIWLRFTRPRLTAWPGHKMSQFTGDDCASPILRQLVLATSNRGPPWAIRRPRLCL